MSTDNIVRDPREEAAIPPPDPRRPAVLPTPDAWLAQKAQYYTDDPRRKSPALAIIMSAMPGLGQIYVGYYQQGFVNILVVAGLITLLNIGGMQAVEPLLGVFLAFFWLYNLVDAGRRASFYNQALAGVDTMALPDDFRLPGGGGALAGGLGLIVFGVILFSNTMFGVSLEWMRQWWPIGLVLAGGYLVYSSAQDRKRRQAGETAEVRR